MKPSTLVTGKYLCIAALLVVTAVVGQDKNDRWTVGAGWNLVDVRGPNHRLQTEDVASVLEDYVKFIPDANLTIGSFRIHTARYLFKGLSIQAAASFNTLKKDYFYYTSGTVKAQAFLALDAKIRYDLNRLVGPTGKFDPYLLLGGGFSKQGNRSGLMGAFGGGFTLWTSDKWGVNLQSDYNGNGQGKELSYFQHSISLVYKISERSKATWVAK